MVTPTLSLRFSLGMIALAGGLIAVANGYSVPLRKEFRSIQSPTTSSLRYKKSEGTEIKAATSRIELLLDRSVLLYDRASSQERQTYGFVVNQLSSLIKYLGRLLSQQKQQLEIETTHDMVLQIKDTLLRKDLMNTPPESDNWGGSVKIELDAAEKQIRAWQRLFVTTQPPMDVGEAPSWFLESLGTSVADESRKAWSDIIRVGLQIQQGSKAGVQPETIDWLVEAYWRGEKQVEALEQRMLEQIQAVERQQPWVPPQMPALVTEITQQIEDALLMDLTDDSNSKPIDPIEVLLQANKNQGGLSARRKAMTEVTTGSRPLQTREELIESGSVPVKMGTKEPIANEMNSHFDEMKDDTDGFTEVGRLLDEAVERGSSYEEIKAIVQKNPQKLEYSQAVELRGKVSEALQRVQGKSISESVVRETISEETTMDGLITIAEKQQQHGEGGEALDTEAAPTNLKKSKYSAAESKSSRPLNVSELSSQIKNKLGAAFEDVGAANLNLSKSSMVGRKERDQPPPPKNPPTSNFSASRPQKPSFRNIFGKRPSFQMASIFGPKQDIITPDSVPVFGKLGHQDLIPSMTSDSSRREKPPPPPYPPPELPVEDSLTKFPGTSSLRAIANIASGSFSMDSLLGRKSLTRDIEMPTPTSAGQTSEDENAKKPINRAKRALRPPPPFSSLQSMLSETTIPSMFSMNSVSSTGSRDRSPLSPFSMSSALGSFRSGRVTTISQSGSRGETLPRTLTPMEEATDSKLQGSFDGNRKLRKDQFDELMRDRLSSTQRGANEVAQALGKNCRYGVKAMGKLASSASSSFRQIMNFPSEVDNAYKKRRSPVPKATDFYFASEFVSPDTSLLPLADLSAPEKVAEVIFQGQQIKKALEPAGTAALEYSRTAATAARPYVRQGMAVLKETGLKTADWLVNSRPETQGIGGPVNGIDPFTERGKTKMKQEPASSSPLMLDRAQKWLPWNNPVTAVGGMGSSGKDDSRHCASRETKDALESRPYLNDEIKGMEEDIEKAMSEFSQTLSSQQDLEIAWRQRNSDSPSDEAHNNGSTVPQIVEVTAAYLQNTDELVPVLPQQRNGETLPQVGLMEVAVETQSESRGEPTLETIVPKQTSDVDLATVWAARNRESQPSYSSPRQPEPATYLAEFRDQETEANAASTFSFDASSPSIAGDFESGACTGSSLKIRQEPESRVNRSPAPAPSKPEWQDLAAEWTAMNRDK